MESTLFLKDENFELEKTNHQKSKNSTNKAQATENIIAPPLSCEKVSKEDNSSNGIEKLIGCVVSFLPFSLKVPVVKIKTSDSINAKILNIWSLMNSQIQNSNNNCSNLQVLLYLVGKDAQKLVSIVEIIKSLIKNNEAISLVDNNNNNNNKENKTIEKKFQFNGLNQYNRLEIVTDIVNVKSSATNVDDTSKTIKQMELFLNDNKKTIQVPVLFVLLQNTDTKLGQDGLNVVDLGADSNKWTLQVV